jgi:hypothetical protein
MLPLHDGEILFLRSRGERKRYSDDEMPNGQRRRLNSLLLELARKITRVDRKKNAPAGFFVSATQRPKTLGDAAGYNA